MARWGLQLMEFDFEVVYQPGAHHQEVDGMSRLSRAFLGEGNGSEAGIDNSIIAFCILGNISNLEYLPKEEMPTPLDVPTAAAFRGA